MLATSCAVCGTPIAHSDHGRPPRYCSAACKQRAYRARKRTPEPAADQLRRPLAHSVRPEVPEKEVPHLERRELLAWRGMLEVQSAILPVLERELRERTGLTLSEFDVLYQLWRMPGKQHRMVDLARALLVTPGGATRIIARLEERSLVVRLTAAGRQAVISRLTPRGERQLEAAMDVHFDGIQRRFLRHLEPTDVDHAIVLWSRLKQGISATEPDGLGAF